MLLTLIFILVVANLIFANCFACFVGLIYYRLDSRLARLIVPEHCFVPISFLFRLYSLLTIGFCLDCYPNLLTFSSVMVMKSCFLSNQSFPSCFLKVKLHYVSHISWGFQSDFCIFGSMLLYKTKARVAFSRQQQAASQEPGPFDQKHFMIQMVRQEQHMLVRSSQCLSIQFS